MITCLLCSFTVRIDKNILLVNIFVPYFSLHEVYVKSSPILTLLDPGIEGLTTEFQVFTMWYGIE